MWATANGGYGKPLVSTCMVGSCSVNVVVFRWAFTIFILSIWSVPLCNTEWHAGRSG